MLIKIFLLNMIFILSLIIGCGSSYEDSQFKFGIGNYKFTMSDSTGKKLAEGTLTVKTSKNNNISGTYTFTKKYVDDFPGLSSMNGEFEGNIVKSTKTVFINTNPRIADSNVFWNMTIRSNSVSGDWNYSVFRGSASRGKVKITKQ